METHYNRTIDTLERLRAESAAAGGPDKISRQHAQGKLTARERILLLLDRGSFEEFDVLKTGRSSALGNVRASGVVPQISCIMGPCAGERLPIRSWRPREAISMT